MALLPPHGAPADGVLTATGEIDGARVFCKPLMTPASGARSGGWRPSRSCTSSSTRSAPARRWSALRRRQGHAFQEGSLALAGYARVFRHSVRLRAVAPQITVVTGTAAGVGAYAPALGDVEVMAAGARMFFTGPAVVRRAVGEQTSADALGGVRVHERNGVCHLIGADDSECFALVRQLFTHLRPDGSSPRATPSPSARPDPGAALPAEARQPYDVRRLLTGVVDTGTLIELAPRWARNMVTALARVDGRTVGVIANQPRHLGGLIDVDACQKSTWFIDLCERFRVPLVVVVDTPGFLPGRRQESAGVIRHGADLVRAFASTTTPRVPSSYARHTVAGR